MWGMADCRIDAVQHDSSGYECLLIGCKHTQPTHTHTSDLCVCSISDPLSTPPSQPTLSAFTLSFPRPAAATGADDDDAPHFEGADSDNTTLSLPPGSLELDDPGHPTDIISSSDNNVDVQAAVTRPQRKPYMNIVVSVCCVFGGGGAQRLKRGHRDMQLKRERDEALREHACVNVGTALYVVQQTQQQQHRRGLYGDHLLCEREVRGANTDAVLCVSVCVCLCLCTRRMASGCLPQRLRLSR